MNEPDQQLDPVLAESESITSYSQRRALRESQPDFMGQNIYGGERCVCDRCGATHWKPIAKVEQEQVNE